MERNLNSVLVEGRVTVGFSQLTEAQFIIMAKSDGEDMPVRVRVDIARLSPFIDRIKVGGLVRVVGHLVPAGDNRVSVLAEAIEFLPVKKEASNDTE
jgi:hypothetical protein